MCSLNLRWMVRAAIDLRSFDSSVARLKGESRARCCLHGDYYYSYWCCCEYCDTGRKRREEEPSRDLARLLAVYLRYELLTGESAVGFLYGST